MSALRPDQTAGHSADSFRLDKANGKFMGVCAGLANRYGMDPLAWRLIFVLGTLFGFGSLIILYLAIGLLAE